MTYTRELTQAQKATIREIQRLHKVEHDAWETAQNLRIELQKQLDIDAWQYYILSDTVS